MKRARWLVGTVALALLFTTACGSAPSSSPSSSGRAAKAAPGTAAQQQKGAGASAAAGSKLSTVIYGTLGATTADWPIYTAEDQGYFQQNGIHLDVVNTNGPANAADALASGSVQIAEDGTDSWVRAVGDHLPVQIVAPEFDTDPYTLITKPSISSWTQMKGKRMIVGTTTDVTAITFDAMAAAHHLTPKDFTFVTAGSTNARYAALKSGHVDAAMLTQPFDILAMSQGEKELATAPKYVPHWLFTSYAVNTKWAPNHLTQIVAFVRSVLEAVRYEYAHKDATIQTLTKHVKVPQTIAAKAYDLDFNQWHAYSKTGKTDPADLQTVVQAVVKQGTVKQAPAESALFDASYVRLAGAK